MSEQMTNQELEKFEQDFASMKPFLTDDVLGEIERDIGHMRPSDISMRRPYSV